MKISILSLLLVCIFNHSICQTTTWLGGVDSDWSNSLNWSNGIPDTTNSALIGTVYHTPAYWPILNENIETGVCFFDKSEFDFNGYELKIVKGTFNSKDAVFNTKPDSAIKIIIWSNTSFDLDTGTVFNNRVQLIKSTNDHPSSATGSSVIWAKLNEFNIPSYVVFNGGLDLLYEDASTLLMYGGIINGDFKFDRTYQGNTAVLTRYGGRISGDFEFNYDSPVSTSDNQTIGTNRNPFNSTTHFLVDIQGKLTISVNNAGFFNLLQTKNNHLNSMINVNAGGVLISDDTLNITSLIFNTGLTNSSLRYNHITADLTSFETTSNSGNSPFRENKFYTPVIIKSSMGNVIREASHANSASHYFEDVTIEGNVIIGYADTSYFYKNLTIIPSASTVINGARFVGNANSKIQSNTLNPLAFGRLIMNKTDGAYVTLEVPVSISNKLSLLGGVIHGSSTNYVQFEQGAIWSGGNNLSHIKGLVKKRGNQSFVFPIGKGNSFNPVSIGAPTLVTDLFSASYHHAPPSSVGDVAIKAPTLESISDCEYWQINREEGTSNVPVTLYYGPPCDFPIDQYINDPSRIRITRWSGIQWEDLGNGGYTSNSITSGGAVSEFSPFTFASPDPLVLVPVNLLSFTGIIANKMSELKWITTQEVNLNRYVVEKSIDGVEYTAISSVPARNLNGTFTYTEIDRTPSMGSNYYRLRIEDLDGSYRYSEIVHLLFNNSGSLQVFPNPAKDIVTIFGLQENQQVKLFDASGRMLKALIVNSINREVDISFLSKGLYFIQVNSNGLRQTIKFIKK